MSCVLFGVSSPLEFSASFFESEKRAASPGMLVFLKKKNKHPDCRGENWGSPHPVFGGSSHGHSALANAPVPAALMSCRSPAAPSIRASRRSGPSTSASSASTAPRPAPSGCSPTSTATSSCRPPSSSTPGRASQPPSVRAIREAVARARPRGTSSSPSSAPGDTTAPSSAPSPPPASRPASSIPSTTKQFRQPADPGNKTDDTDLAAIHRAAVNGFALLEPASTKPGTTLRLARPAIAATWSARPRALRCQIREHLDAAHARLRRLLRRPLGQRASPGICPATSARPPTCSRPASPAWPGASDDAGVRFHRRDPGRRSSPGPAGRAARSRRRRIHRRIALALDDDRLAKKPGNHGAGARAWPPPLARTPYVLLLSLPRHQRRLGRRLRRRDGADRALRQRPRHHRPRRPVPVALPERSPSIAPTARWSAAATAALRAAIMCIADNLIKCNHHFHVLARLARAGRQGPAAHPRQGRRALLPHRLPDGRRPAGVPPSRACKGGTTSWPS